MHTTNHHCHRHRPSTAVEEQLAQLDENLPTAADTREEEATRV